MHISLINHQSKYKFHYSPPEQIRSSPTRHQNKCTVRRLTTRENTQFACSPPEQMQFADSPPEQIQPQFHYSPPEQKQAKFHCSPPEEIHISPTRHQSRYTVRLLATKGNAQFADLPPEQVHSSPTRHMSKYTVHLLVTRTNRFIVQMIATEANITVLLLATRSNRYLPAHWFSNGDDGNICLLRTVSCNANSLEWPMWRPLIGEKHFTEPRQWVNTCSKFCSSQYVKFHSHYEVTTCMNYFSCVLGCWYVEINKYWD